MALLMDREPWPISTLRDAKCISQTTLPSTPVINTDVIGTEVHLFVRVRRLYKKSGKTTKYFVIQFTDVSYTILLTLISFIRPFTKQLAKTQLIYFSKGTKINTKYYTSFNIYQTGFTSQYTLLGWKDFTYSILHKFIIVIVIFKGIYYTVF